MEAYYTKNHFLPGSCNPELTKKTTLPAKDKENESNRTYIHSQRRASTKCVDVAQAFVFNHAGPVHEQGRSGGVKRKKRKNKEPQYITYLTPSTNSLGIVHVFILIF